MKVWFPRSVIGVTLVSMYVDLDGLDPPPFLDVFCEFPEIRHRGGWANDNHSFSDRGRFSLHILTSRFLVGGLDGSHPITNRGDLPRFIQVRSVASNVRQFFLAPIVTLAGFCLTGLDSDASFHVDSVTFFIYFLAPRRGPRRAHNPLGL